MSRKSFLILLAGGCILIFLTNYSRCETPKFINPVPGFEWITSDTGGFECTKGRKSPHKGIDIGGQTPWPEPGNVAGATVVASAAGKVIRANWSESYGHVIYIRHNEDWVTRYAHLKELTVKVKKGDPVTTGQEIGNVGKTGRDATGCHLHYEIRYKGKPVDPALLIYLSTDSSFRARGNYYCGSPLTTIIHPAQYVWAFPGHDHPDESYDVSTTIGSVTFPISDYDTWLIDLYTPFAIKKNKQGLLTKFKLRQIVKEISEYIDNLTVDSSPDETYLQSLYSEAQSLWEKMPIWNEILQEFNSTPDISVLNHGYSDSVYSFIFNKFSWEPIRVREVDFAPDTTDNPILIIPTGGLYGLDSSSTFRQNLADYVQNGGTLICFAQQHGYEFNALPGGEVSGYGWNEDQSCHTNAAYIDTYHPVFAGQNSANLDASVDGYFTNWAEDAIVLLRRTKNGMPAMVAYPYGLGWVVVSTLYSDWSYGHGGITPDETRLIRDLISWAKNPDREIKEYKPADTVSITIPVTNYSNSPSNSILLTLLDPNKKVMSTTEVVHPLNPGESAEISFSCTASLTLGIWWVNYALKDSSGNTIQPETEELTELL